MHWKWYLAQQLEGRWWKRYLARKDPATYQQWKRDYWERIWAMTGWEKPSGLGILDAGCGPAGIFIWLDGNRVYAVDPLLDHYSTLDAHFRREQFPWVQFENRDLESLDDFDMPQVDLVCCTNALNHVRDLENVLGQLGQRLKPDGRFMVTIDVHRSRFGQRLLQTIPLDVLHPYQLRLEEYLALFEAAGIIALDASLIKEGFWFDHYLLTGKKS